MSESQEICMTNSADGWMLVWDALKARIRQLRSENAQYQHRYEMNTKTSLFGRISPAYQLNIDHNNKQIKMIEEEAKKISDQLIDHGILPTRIGPWIYGKGTAKKEHRKLTEREMERMVDVCASGPLDYRPVVDVQLLELGLLVWWDGMVGGAVEHNPETPFYAENGRILKEWYGFK